MMVFESARSVEIHCSTRIVSLPSIVLNFAYNKIFNEAESAQNSQRWIMQFLLFASQASALIIFYGIYTKSSGQHLCILMNATNIFYMRPSRSRRNTHFGFKNQNFEKLIFNVGFCSLKILYSSQPEPNNSFFWWYTFLCRLTLYFMPSKIWDVWSFS